MGAPEEGIVVMIGLAEDDSIRELGYGEDGDLFTGEPFGDCCGGPEPTGGVGAGLEGCIELCFGGDCGTGGIRCVVCWRESGGYWSLGQCMYEMCVKIYV